MAEQLSEEEMWDQKFRRKIRSDQRKLISDVHKNREDITLPEKLMKHVKCLDKLMSNVVASKEAAIDAEGFRLLSTIGREQVEATHGNLIQFDSSTYAEKLLTIMGGRRGTKELQWADLGEKVVNVFNKPPPPNFLFGALELEPPKKRKASAPRKRLDKEAGKGAGSTAKQLENLQNEEESTTKDVQHIMKHAVRACREKGRIGYFQFLVDPHSFARTVENMFHFSFLVKDGRTGVTLGKDGIPYIYLPSEVNEYGQSLKTTKNQVIITLTMDDWKRAIKKFGLTEASIPPRE